MGKINLLIANAGDNFTESEIATIKEAGLSAENFINSHFDFDYNVDIIVTAPSFLMQSIPEDGISGRAFSSRLLAIVLDKDEAQIAKNTVFETICHEMSHSLRWEKLPEYANTLFGSIILEGLATVLEERALEYEGITTPQFFLKTVKETPTHEYSKMIETLKSSLDDEKYDHVTIFYTGDDTLPRWAGYRLGYFYVKKYLEETGRSIEEATLDSYSLFRKYN